MIRCGVDAWNLPHDRRGIGRYLRSILREWTTRFTDRIEPVLIVPEWHTWTVRDRYLRETPGITRITSRTYHRFKRLDVLWFPWNGCSWTTFSLPAVATLHDATNFVLPGYAPETQRIFRAAADRCNALITDSHFSRDELIRELALDPSRITAIPLGVDVPARIPELPEPLRALEPYVLFVGTTEKRKGIEALVRAMGDVQRTRPDVTLVLAGARGDGVTGNERVRMHELGWIDDETLGALYAHASVFAFPSRYEGFGLPPLEALSYGTPVVTTNATSIPEATGDAALYVGIDDADAIARAILRILSDDDVRADLAQRGRARAAAMSWTTTAERTLEIIERAR